MLKFSIYGNILIDSVSKLQLAVSNLKKLVSETGLTAIIRVRGRFALQFANSFNNNKQIQVMRGEEFSLWRNQTVFDLDNICTPYILLFLEDHIFVGNQQLFKNQLELVVRHDVDLFQYSWFPQYQAWRNCDVFTKGDSVKENIVWADITQETLEELKKTELRWVVSMTSVFKKEVLIDLLKMSRPIIKKTNPRAPFDVEKSPNHTFYLPLRLALPKQEIFVCVDDDNTIPNSSAISRGIVKNVIENREVRHHSTNSPIQFVNRLSKIPIISQLKENIPISMRRKIGDLMLIPTFIMYSVESVFLSIRDELVWKKRYRN